MASIIIWALSYFPRYSFDEIPQSYVEATLADMPETVRSNSSEEKINENILQSYQQEHSILGRIGKFCEPVVRPMDWGWKPCVSLMAGMAAKEIVVSTMGVLYVGDDDAAALSQRLKTPSALTGKAPFTTASALAFLVFVLLYFPCIATLAAIIRETGNWRYGLFSLLYNTGLAWVVAMITYNIAILF